MSNTIYKITVLNWKAHNLKHKDSYKKTLIPNNFCNDAKIKVLPMSVRWMFLGLLLVCGDLSKDTVEVDEGTLKGLLGSGYRTTEALNLLKSIPLLTYQKIEFLRIEKKLNKENRIEINKQRTEKHQAVVVIENSESVSTEPTTSVPVVVEKVTNKIIFKISESKQVGIKKELVQAWADTYPKDFLEGSFKDMRNWVLSNEQKAPKSDWAKFMNGWFRRGWEQYRKTLKSNPSKITVDDLNDILGGLS